jgi:hypothetical protein
MLEHIHDQTAGVDMRKKCAGRAILSTKFSENFEQVSDIRCPRNPFDSFAGVVVSQLALDKFSQVLIPLVI